MRYKSGKFTLPGRLVRDHPEATMEIMGNFAVFRAEHHFSYHSLSGVVEYNAFSPLFGVAEKDEMESADPPRFHVGRDECGRVLVQDSPFTWHDHQSWVAECHETGCTDHLFPVRMSSKPPAFDYRTARATTQDEVGKEYIECVTGKTVVLRPVLDQ